MKTHTLKFDIHTFESLKEMPEIYIRLVEAAQKASLGAYAPYSKFNVGAAVLLDNGEIVCGNNQENCAYPSGLCAERVALFYANARFPEVGVQAIAISSSTGEIPNTQPISPCGACRQVIIESEIRYGKAITVIMAGSMSIKLVKSSHVLLPLSFEFNNNI